MSKKVLAFDFGASSGRAMIGELSDGKLSVTEIHRFSNDPVILGGTMYWDYLRLWHEIKAGIRLALASGRVDAIGIDTWGVDFGLLDEAGDLIANPVHYRDERTVGMPEELFKVLPKDALYAKTGIQMMRLNTIYQLWYLSHHRPELLSRAKHLLFMPDLMAYSLTGVMRTEETIASTSNLLDPYTKSLSGELLSLIGVDSSLFSPMIRPGETYGMLSEALCAELGCEPIPVIAVCTHDTASAVAATPASGDFAYVSCGTWSLFGTELPAPMIDAASAEAEYTNEGGYGGTTRFLRNIMGLWLIQESRRQWIREGETVSYADLEREALAAPAFRSFIDCDAPEFETAGDLPSRIRAFCCVTGQHVPDTRGEVMRTIYASLAMTYRENMQKLVSLTGKEYKTLHMLGGGIKDTLLCRLAADAIGTRVVAGPSEATVFGNIAVQMLALGELSSLAEARSVIAASENLKIYDPKDTALWAESEAAYRAVLGKSAIR